MTRRRRPRVSVVMPMRDAEPYVRDAVGSILAQTVSDLELIIVDDGSRDGSAAAVAETVAGDGRVLLVGQERAGVVAASERARALCRGPVIARMDADDIASPERLELQLERLAVGDVAACGGQVEFFPRDDLGDGMRRYESWLNGLTSPELAARDVFVEVPIAHPTLTIDRAALSAAGGWRMCGWPEDYDLTLRLYRRGVAFASVDEVVLRWRDHSNRLTWTDERYRHEAFMRCRVHHLRAHLGRRAESLVIFGCGPVGKAHARELQRQGSTIAAFLEVNPRKIGKRVHGAFVYGMDEAPRLARVPAIGAVAGHDARAEIRRAARAAGWVEGVDFFAVA